MCLSISSRTNCGKSKRNQCWAEEYEHPSWFMIFFFHIAFQTNFYLIHCVCKEAFKNKQFFCVTMKVLYENGRKFENKDKCKEDSCHYEF